MKKPKHCIGACVIYSMGDDFNMIGRVLRHNYVGLSTEDGYIYTIQQIYPPNTNIPDNLTIEQISRKIDFDTLVNFIEDFSTPP